MFEFLCAWIGVILIGGAIYAYRRTKDGLHPAVAMAPLFFYVYVSTPILTKEGLLNFFSIEQLDYVAGFYLAAAICFYAGLLLGPKRVGGADTKRQTWAFLGNPRVRKRIFVVAVLFGCVALAAYLYSVESVGGFIKAYSRVKGGGRAESGYIGEATLFSFPAIILLAISRRRLRVRPVDVWLALLFALPHLLQGTFGGRRGPLFLILGILFIAWFIAKGRTPSFKVGMIAVGVAGLAVVFVWSQRHQVYLGSEKEFDANAFLQRTFAEEAAVGSTYVSGAASILTSDYLNRHYWGYRYFVTFAIRPIPKQLWPTKYEDMGADWLRQVDEEETAYQYRDAVGFALLSGFATGSFADGYMEFAWGAVVMFFLLGALYSLIWRRHRQDGGFWTVMFAVSLVLSIYLATQSVTAWGTRMMYVSFFTFVLWRFWLKLPVGHRPLRSRHSPVFGRVALIPSGRQRPVGGRGMYPQTAPEAGTPRSR
jgi:oligosaccharide repeat unit polymerase